MIALAEKLSKSFGPQLLWSDVVLQLNAGERWGLLVLTELVKQHF